MRLTDRTVDLARLAIEHDDGSVGALTAREGALLAYLAQRPEQDVTRDELLEHVWEYRANYATRAVDVAVRRLRAKVEPDPSSPVHLISVHGVGYRFVPAQLPAPAHAAPTERGQTNLPADQTSFVGRADDLAAIARQFRGGARLVTILGPGGIGKTRMAQRFGRTVLESAAPPGGVWFCELAEAVALPGLVAAVAGALGVPIAGGSGGEQLSEQIGHALAERGPILVILDNFEQLVEHAPVTLARWLRRAPQARFLVSSRERLRIPGEAVYELGPLREDDALVLFVERARAAGADLEAQDTTLRAIIQRLDGLPLAIELAAPRARVLEPSQLLDRLSARFRLLRSSGPPAVSPRQATLRGAIDWSWELLTPWERAALAQCAAFSGGFTLEAVEAVLQLDDPDAPWALDIVEALRDKSLLRVYEPAGLPGELRFGTYESIRVYALERLGDDTAALYERHAAWYVAEGERLAEQVDGHGGLDALKRLALERDNLLAVWRRMSQPDADLAIRAVLALEAVFHTRGPFDLWLGLVDELVGLAEEQAPPLLPRALVARANAHGLRGQLDRAREDLLHALPRVAGRADEEEVRALHALGVVEAEQSRVEAAEERFQEALALTRSLGLRRWEGVILGLLGAVELMRGAVPAAEDQMRRALAIHQEVGNERHQAVTWANLGMIQLDHGRLAEAERHLQEAVAIDRRQDNARRVATSLLTLGAVRCAQWRLEEAEALVRDALRVYRSVGYQRFAGVAVSSLGTIALARQRPQDALEELRGALEILEEVGDRQSTCLTIALLAAVHAERDALDAATRTLEHAERLSDELGFGQGHAFARAARGFLLLAQAREARRRGAVHESESLQRAARDLREGEPGDEGFHARRFFSAILERALARDEGGAGGPW